YDMGHHGLLSRELVFRIARLIKLVQKPSFLNKLRVVKKYMDLLEKLYTVYYPDKPVEIYEWMDRVDRVIREYCLNIDYVLGEKVKW
ncbi:MAG: geranylgeranyl reductase, partial [Desulfurococcaceae archaeon]